MDFALLCESARRRRNFGVRRGRRAEQTTGKARNWPGRTGTLKRGRALVLAVMQMPPKAQRHDEEDHKGDEEYP